MGGERSFRWLSGEPLPARYDLRRLGWCLGGGLIGRRPTGVTLAVPFALSAAALHDLLSAANAQRRRTLALEIDDPLDRSALLRLGFAEVLHSACDLDELGLRAARLAEAAEGLPRVIAAGPISLDLVQRDGWMMGRPLGLNPREFALVWHLARAGGRAVSQTELLREIWGLGFKPETNSLAVHISRLRSKLRLVGVDGLVQTTPNGAYRLASSGAGHNHKHLYIASGKLGLDGYVRLGDEAATRDEDADHEAGIQS